jgi:nucleoid-associated protein YgaU
MWQAVASAPLPYVEGEVMSSQEYATLSQQLAAVGARVERLEAAVSSLSGTPAPVPERRTYTVQPGDTLSGIARKLGLGGWQRLYQANVRVIGGDPNRIFPGQVLVVP